LGNSFTHFEFTTAGNANSLAADEKELAYQCVCYWRFKRSFRFARQMQNYTPFLRANEAFSITAAHTLSGRQSRHLILQVRRHSITVVLSSNKRRKKLESASQNSSAACCPLPQRKEKSRHKKTGL
jgi:hypothetical protein